MKSTLLLVACVSLLWGCARLHIAVDIYEPGPQGLTETATAYDFRAFAQFFAAEENRIQQLLDGEVKGDMLMTVEECFEGGDIASVKASVQTNFATALQKRDKWTKDIASVIRGMLGQYDLLPTDAAPALARGAKRQPLDTEIRVARLQLVPILLAREDGSKDFLVDVKKDLGDLSQSCERLARKREQQGRSEESASLRNRALDLKAKSQGVQNIPQIVEARGRERQLLKVAEVTTVVGGSDPNAPLLVREDAPWRMAFNEAKSFSGLSKGQSIVVQESLTDYRVKTVTSDPRQVFNTAVEIGKQMARTVSMIYGFPAGAAPAASTSGTAAKSPVDTVPLLDQQTEALRLQEGRLTSIQRELRQELQNSLAALRARTFTGGVFEAEKAKIQGAIDRTLNKLEAELASMPALEEKSSGP